MTDKHIPASKLEELPTYCKTSVNGYMDSELVLRSKIRALIDEAPEVELGVRLGIQIAPTVILSKDFSHLSTDDGILIQSWLNSAYEKIDEIYNRPSPDLTKLVGELVEALEKSREKLQIECGGNREYKGGVPTQVLFPTVDTLLTCAKEYLK